jgi:hypothetical protein
MKDLIINSKYSLRVSKPWLACKLIKINAQLFFTQKIYQNILISKKSIEVYFTVTSNNTILQLMKPY